MVHLLTILAFACARWRELAGTPAPEEAVTALAWLPPAGSALLAVVAWCVCAWAGERMDRAGDFHAYSLAHRAQGWARLGSAALLVVGVWAWGWDRLVRGTLGDSVLLDDVLIALPLLGVIVFSWWASAPLERRVRDAVLLRELQEGRGVTPPMSRVGHVWMQVRHQVLLVALPVMGMLAWGDVLTRARDWTSGTGLEGLGAWVDAWSGWLHWAGVLVVLALAPMAVRWIWGAVHLEAGELRSAIRAVCDRHRVRVRGPFVWRTDGASVNGAILGLVYPFRYLLLTDALLERLEAGELEAVVAHEVAHVRHHHMPWLAGATMGGALLGAWSVEAAAVLLDGRVPESVLLTWGTAISLVVAGLTFGFVSRRFEWQADAFAAGHLARARGEPRISGPVAALVSGTLGRVASLNGMNARAFSFRHGSIASRRERVLALEGLDPARLPIDRSVRVLKVLSAIVVGISLLALAWDALA